MLTLFHVIRKRLFRGRTAARSIQREREIFRRWSQRSTEDRFSL